MVGKTIAHYEITAKIGEGGMGVVYRARDTKLGRDVALKVLPEQFARDPQRMGRFSREARVLASLNHPNIASIYGVEEQNGVHALVMELVEGPTLADRISEGPIPLDEALPLAEQMAQALEYAHEHGVIHRDLKPANVKVTEEGTVKVLDFGLAKAMEDEAATGDPADSPTLTLGATKAGVILGTAAYMAPEQARAKRVDKRADIWAFGVVLYEMLTGQRLFRGEDLTETLAAVVMKEPDLSAAPPKVRRLLQRCLEKDPKKRLRDISVVWELLEEERPEQAPVRRSRLWPAVAAVFAIAFLAVTFVLLRQAPPELQPVQFSIEAPPEFAFYILTGGYAASPDGRYVVFAAQDEEDNTISLWLRPLDSQTARPLPGTEGGLFPTWSPDSRSLAFYADGQLKRIEITGGPPLPLGEANADAVTPTGTWNREGIILFGSAAGLQQVSASDGGVEPLTEVDHAQQETGHGYPQFLPDGDRFLYFVASRDPNVRGVYASSLSDSSQRTLVIRTAAKAVYVPPRAAYPGYLLWLQDRTLVARRFNPDSLEFEGDASTVAEDINLGNTYTVRASFWASEAGLLTYFAEDVSALKRIVWMTRDGVELGEVAPEGAYSRLALSPDGERLAVSLNEVSGSGGEPNLEIHVIELASGRRNKVTLHPAQDDWPTWSPDGKEVAFSSDREGGVLQIYRKDASGFGEAERLTDGPNPRRVYDWSPDGLFLACTEYNPDTGWDAMVLPLEDDRRPIPLAQRESRLSAPEISPDGQLVAFYDDYSGVRELFVQPFPGTEGVSQDPLMISSGGGNFAKWRDDSKELYYQSLDGDLMAVTIDAGSQGIQRGTPRELLTGLQLRLASMQFDVSRDGERFLLLLPSTEQEEIPLTVDLNWQARLER